jgi:3-demethoxyubiquinol 3-hydroxylase
MTRSNPKDRSRPRPGYASGARRLDEILRVDHAGELGAVRIYQGQLAVLGAMRRTRRSCDLVRHMAEQEAHHKAAFDHLLTEHQTRPTALEPLWSAAGFALGAATALIGEKAAMACTVAVEDVIEDHYRRQAEEMAEVEPELAGKLQELRGEELEHRAAGLAAGGEKATAYPMLSGLIKAGCRLAIRIAEKV